MSSCYALKCVHVYACVCARVCKRFVPNYDNITYIYIVLWRISFNKIMALGGDFSSNMYTIVLNDRLFKKKSYNKIIILEFKWIPKTGFRCLFFGRQHITVRTFS